MCLFINFSPIFLSCPIFSSKSFLFNTQNRWSINAKYLLCTEKVSFSSPTVCPEMQNTPGMSTSSWAYRQTILLLEKLFLACCPLSFTSSPFLFPEISDSAYQSPHFSPFIFKINHWFIFFLPFQQ